MHLSRKLMALGAFFVLALVVAGCGGGSGGVPSNSVATVAGNPISTRAFDHWMYVAAKGNAAQTPGAPVIVPNDPPGFANCIKQARAQIPALKKTPAKTLRTECGTLFTSLNSTVMDFLIKAYWYQLLAHKEHINISQAQLKTAFAKAEKQSNLTTPAQVKNFLTESGQTINDLRYRIRVNEIYKALVNRQVKKVTPAAISNYYSSHQSQFGSPQTRDIRIVRTNSKSQAQAAYNALKSGQSWQTVAKKYSVDTSKNSGGLLKGVTNGEEEHALNQVAFSAPVNKLEGPVHGSFGWYVVQVVKITPSTHQSLAKARPLIKQLLTSQYQTQATTKIDQQAKKDFGKRTLCRSAYSMADCSGYKPPKASSTTGTGATGSGATGSGGTGSGATGSGATGSGSTGSTGSTTSSGSSKKSK